MKTCEHCGALNNDSDRYCDWCGSMLPVVNEKPVRDGSEHDFTTGVMRYAPDLNHPENKAFPVYLTRQAAVALQQTQEGTLETEAAGGVPDPLRTGPVTAAVPPSEDSPQGMRKERNQTAGKHKQKRSGSRLAAIIVMSLIGILVILIVVGIAVLLGG